MLMLSNYDHLTIGDRLRETHYTHFTPVDEALFSLFSQNGGFAEHLELRFCLEIRCLNYMIFVIGILTYAPKAASKRGASKILP